MNQSPNFRSLHKKALALANTYKKTESDLLIILGEIDRTKTFIQLKYKSLFDYCVRGLGLPEGTSYNLITVSRKANEVPELQKAVCDGKQSVSKAKKIVSVITCENKAHWISLAQELPRLALEKEVAKFSPKKSIPERTKYVSGNVLLLGLGISEEVMNKIRRVQDLESKRKKTTVSIKKVLDVITDGYLKRNDPVLKAERQHDRLLKVPTSPKLEADQKSFGTEGKSDQEPARLGKPPLFPGTVQNTQNSVNHRSYQSRFTRKPLNSAVRRQVYRRDKGLCQYQAPMR